MKSIIFLFLFLPFLAHSDPPSLHGMLVVGSNKIYLSHLPMFHSPHDYQVLFEAEFDPRGTSLYKNAKTTSPETVYTIAPEHFVLPDMVRHPRPFKAQLFQGHFERQGRLLSNQIVVTIKKVLFFKKFKRTEARPAHSQYILFGNADEQFIAHHVTSAPDFDQILQIQTQFSLTKLLAEAPFVGLIFHSVKNTKPLAHPQTYQATLDGPGGIVTIQTAVGLYFETGDLAH